VLKQIINPINHLFVTVVPDAKENKAVSSIL